jgi:hypothetical protein
VRFGVNHNECCVWVNHNECVVWSILWITWSLHEPTTRCAQMGTFEAQSSYRKAWSTGRLWVPSMWGWGHDPMCFLCGKILSKAIRLLILIYLWSDGLTMIDYYFINKLNWIMKKHKCETIVIRFSCVFIPMLRTWPEDPGQHLQPYERNYFAWAAGCQWGCAGAGDIGQRTGTCGL